MDLQLTGRAVFVTGGSRGVGRAVVDRLLAEGAVVATCARDSDALAKAYAGVDPDRLLLGPCDVMDQGALQQLVDRAARRFGRLDAVVANAGAGTVGGVLESPPEIFAEQFATKVDSVLNLVRAAGPHLASADSPAVVVVNSVTAHRPEGDMAAVSAARAAVASVVVLLAERLATEGIRVNAVNLGAIVTDGQRQRHAASGSEESFEAWCGREALRRRIPLGRMGLPDEVAPVVALLASPLSGYITGASVDVSGGLGVRP